MWQLLSNHNETLNIPEETAQAFLDQPRSDCFHFVVASPKHSISNGSKIETPTPQECQTVCRKTSGCKMFQWSPKIWKKSGQCRLKTMEPKWSRYEWYLLPDAVAGPPICTRKLVIFPKLYFENI